MTINHSLFEKTINYACTKRQLSLPFYVHFQVFLALRRQNQPWKQLKVPPLLKGPKQWCWTTLPISYVQNTFSGTGTWCTTATSKDAIPSSSRTERTGLRPKQTVPAMAATWWTSTNRWRTSTWVWETR